MPAQAITSYNVGGGKIAAEVTPPALAKAAAVIVTTSIRVQMARGRELIYPCTNIRNPVTIPIPPYVRSDYFCDTASETIIQWRFYPNDPLWDGQGCSRLNTCCSFNNPPWFMKELPSSTSEDIEMRLCADQARTDEDITFETIELYVQ